MIYIVFSVIDDDAPRVEGVYSESLIARTIEMDRMGAIDAALAENGHEVLPWTAVGEIWNNGFAKVYTQKYKLN